MGRRPPVYTFQRRRKKSQSQPDLYTEVPLDMEDTPQDEMVRYIRYTFFVNLCIFLVLLFVSVYAFYKGFPVKMKM